MRKKEEKKEERWLDELIWRAVDSGNVEFDAEKWKEKYPEEFQLLKSRAKQSTSYRQASLFRIVLQSRISKLAAAAVIIIAVGFFVVHRRPVERIKPPEVLEVTKSPAELTTFASLTFAYRQGGIELVEEMCDRAITLAGPRPARISMQELFEELNSKDLERTKL